MFEEFRSTCGHNSCRSSCGMPIPIKTCQEFGKTGQ